MDAPQLPPNYSIVAQAEQIQSGEQSVLRDHALRQQADAQRQRAIEVAGRLAVEQTTQR